MKVVYIAMLCLIVGCKKKQQTIKPILQTITQSVYASGTIKSNNQYKVFTTVSGIIETVLVAENDEVSKGTPLFLIANELQELQEKNAELTYNFNTINFNKGKLQDAQSLINVANKKMKNDALMVERLQNLWNEGIGKKVELEQSKLTYENAKAAYSSALQKFTELKKQLSFSSQQAQNNLKLSSKNKNDFTVKSSINGKVYQINTKKGELVSPQMPLAIIGNTNDFVLEMQVDEYDIVVVVPALEVFVVLNSYKNEVFKAKVTKINPIMNVQTKTFTVEASFIDKPPILYPATSFEANILIKTKQNALLIPRSFVKNDSIVLLSTGKERIVKTGMKDFNMIEIIEGINENDVLVMHKK